jgi:hypothetical protein
MVGATTVVESIPVGDFVPWARIPLGNPDVIEVLSVTDSDANEWFEVDYLSQNVVFDQAANLDPDSDTVPYVLKFRSASKRFVVDRSLARSTVHLQFGPGQGLKFDDEIVPNVAQLALPLLGRRTFSLFALDPQNFLKTQSMGLSPFNTVVTVKYRAGGGPETNVPVGSIKTPLNSILQFKSTSLNPATVDTVRSSIECINREASEGGGPAETTAEIKSNAASFFAAQNRCVTREDYLTHVLSMPSRFGRPEKAYVRLSDNNPLSIDVHMLARDIDGKLVRATPTLQKNVITYISRLRMITEGVNIRPAYVINLGVDFGVVVSPKFNRTEVMASCLGAIRDKLDTDKMQIGQPIVYSDLETTLQNVDGVISVYQLNVKSFFSPRNGLTYSQDVSFDVDAATKHGIIYCPQDSIFEIRHPEADITGASK